MLPGPDYVRIAEAVFVARLDSSDDSAGEWRYAWTEQAFDPTTGSYSDAVPAREGTTAINYATELNGRLLPTGASSPLVWIRLKGDVGCMLVYEVLGECCVQMAGYVETQWTTTTNNYTPPEGVDIVNVSSSQVVTLTGMVLLDSQMITLFNGGNYTILITHESSSSTNVNRFDLVTDGLLALEPGGVATFWHDPESDRNVLIESSLLVTAPVQTETISANTNNLAVDPGAESILFTLDGDYNLTGLTSGYPGRPLTLTNSEDSTGTFTLIDGSSSSSVGNRLDTFSNQSIPVRPGKSIDLIYTGDAGSGLWTVQEPPLIDYPYSPTGIGGPYDDYPIPPNIKTFAPVLTSDTTFTTFDVADADVGSSMLVVNRRSNSNTITLPHDSGSGTAGNRMDFSTAMSVVLDPGESALLVYDGSRYLDASISLGAAIGSTVQAYDSMLQDIADLTDPGADRIPFWDDSDGNIVWLDVGAGLSISGTTISVSSPSTPTWTKYTKTYSDFSDASTGKTVTLVTTGAKTVVHSVIIKHSQAFSGGALAGYDVSVGYTGSDTFFIPLHNSFAAVSDTAFSQTEVMSYFHAGTGITARATSTAANLNAASQGSVDIWVLTSTLP